MTCLGTIEVVALSIAALLLTKVIAGKAALSRLALALRRTIALTAGTVLLVLATICLILLLLELAEFFIISCPVLCLGIVSAETPRGQERDPWYKWVSGKGNSSGEDLLLCTSKGKS